ncbi:MAG: hypothetical protein DCF22_23380 [Leptolyngbya sp.]|nr:MAG: hypothetical protein DCF22_23380 [Leptolyngbya sp.]
MSDRLAKLEKLLKDEYEKLDALREGSGQTPDDEKRIQNNQKIRDKIKPQIREYEEEYLRTLQHESVGLVFVEADAQATIDVVAAEIDRVERKAEQYPEEVLQLLQEIKAKLNQPGTSAAAKLKGSLSLMPPFVNLSYEGELDTENFFRRNFPTFMRLLKGAKK